MIYIIVIVIDKIRDRGLATLNQVSLKYLEANHKYYI